MKIKPCKCKKEKCIGFLHTIIERLERQDIGMEAEIEFHREGNVVDFVQDASWLDDFQQAPYVVVAPFQAEKGIFGTKRLEGVEVFYHRWIKHAFSRAIEFFIFNFDDAF